jgi:hypothetical protein
MLGIAFLVATTSLASAQPVSIGLLIPSDANPARRGDPALYVLQTAAGARCHAQLVENVHLIFLAGATAGSDGRVTLWGDDAHQWSTFTATAWYDAGPRILTVTCSLNGASTTQAFRFDVLY